MRVSGRYIGCGSEGVSHVFGETAFGPKCDVKGRRVTLSILGSAYVEAVPDSELLAISAREARETEGRIHGEGIYVTVPEGGPGARAIGRFGWKDQDATLLSASAEALRDETGVPNKYFPAPWLDSSSSGETEFSRDRVGDSELAELVAFLRSTSPVQPDPEQSALPDVREGSRIFDQIGCSVCHVRTLTTAPAGTKVLGGTLIVSKRLGGRNIHPYSDFLLHNVGAGDGIIENIRAEDYDKTTANKFRTPPLWGLRYRSWLMHDGKSFTYHQAIMRHGGEATDAVRAYENLTPQEQEDLREFLNSL